MTWGQIRYTQSLFHGISAASLPGNVKYFIFDCFVRWQVSQVVTLSQTDYLMPGQ